MLLPVATACCFMFMPLLPCSHQGIYDLQSVVIGTDLLPHLPAHLPPQAARRHLTILATSSMTQAKDGGTAGG
jgi:hypothetical protein